MSDGTKIEWTDATWNPITGCSVVSLGCTNCYAMRLAGTRLQHHPSRAGLTDASKAGPVWNGKVRLNEQWLDQPLRWKKPRMIFVCAHGDLFHENVPDQWIDRVFSVMARASWHKFQVLTKRSARMVEYISDREDREIGRAMDSQLFGDVPVPVLPNLWLGVSVEDQTRADDRIADLIHAPAEVRFLSVEPLIEPITFEEDELSWLDWVIVGGESGHGARPMDPEWARSIRDQCADVGVAFFMKQMAKKAAIPDDLMIRQFPK